MKAAAINKAMVPSATKSQRKVRASPKILRLSLRLGPQAIRIVKKRRVSVNLLIQKIKIFITTTSIICVDRVILSESCSSLKGPKIICFRPNVLLSVKLNVISLSSREKHLTVSTTGYTRSRSSLNWCSLKTWYNWIRRASEYLWKYNKIRNWKPSKGIRYSAEKETCLIMCILWSVGSFQLTKRCLRRNCLSPSTSMIYSTSAPSRQRGSATTSSSR